MVKLYGSPEQGRPFAALSLNTLSLLAQRILSELAAAQAVEGPHGATPLALAADLSLVLREIDTRLSEWVEEFELPVGEDAPSD